ncbi:DUF4192 domain-containing protein [Dactylosporangium salmoneum]|uniref:DUF4192 domain-containing protein n=1 Tax=Dactylosporangium salmoneum TaxID=53361 RepID=A0ABN3H4F5_9ACTN
MASRLRPRGPAELLSAMPYMLGFHPTDSLVALGLRGASLHLLLRCDLPASSGDGDVLADQYAHMFRRNALDGALLIGYGPPARAEPFLRTVADALTGCGIPLLDVLRTHEGRFWSLACERPGCCPPEGRPFDPTTSVIAAEATLAGLVALPDRSAVEAGFAGPSGPALAAMEEAGNRANLRVLRLVTGREPAAVRSLLLGAGRAALEGALGQYEAGRRLTDDEVAWMQVLLHIVAFRDRAWRRLDRDLRRGGPAAQAHRQLWTDLVRRCEPGAAAPAATMLAYLSWRDGDGLRATLALDRALDADPGYSAAGLMSQILGRGLSPEQLPALPRVGRRRRRPPGKALRAAGRPGRREASNRPAPAPGPGASEQASAERPGAAGRAERRRRR